MIPVQTALYRKWHQYSGYP